MLTGHPVLAVSLRAGAASGVAPQEGARADLQHRGRRGIVYRRQVEVEVTHRRRQVDGEEIFGVQVDEGGRR